MSDGGGTAVPGSGAGAVPGARTDHVVGLLLAAGAGRRYGYPKVLAHEGGGSARRSTPCGPAGAGAFSSCWRRTRRASVRGRGGVRTALGRAWESRCAPDSMRSAEDPDAD